jgi:hypothetical protein
VRQSSPVNLDLRNADGTPRLVGGNRLFSDATQFVIPVLNSPAFSDTFYTSSKRPTQFTDAVQRAEFLHQAGASWHTLLRDTYSFALNPDGSCCALVLIDVNAFVNGLFPATDHSDRRRRERWRHPHPRHLYVPVSQRLSAVCARLLELGLARHLPRHDVRRHQRPQP